MKILFDQGTPVPLRRHLHPHTVDTAAELGWSDLQNGDLLSKAEDGRYDLMVTTDQNLQYQQNLSDRSIGIIVLKTTSWPRIKTKVDEVSRAVNDLPAGGYAEIVI
jgi:hypothetical protein